MVGENFEIYMSQMAENTLKIIYHGWRNELKLSIMVGENKTKF